MRLKKLNHKRLLALICGLLLCTVIGVDYWAYPYGIAINGRSYNHGENGLWLRYLWYFGQQRSPLRCAFGARRAHTD